MTELERAIYILDGIDRRRAARIESGNIGEWQTEINEVARALHCLIAHMEASDADTGQG